VSPHTFSIFGKRDEPSMELEDRALSVGMNTASCSRLRATVCRFGVVRETKFQEQYHNHSSVSPACYCAELGAKLLLRRSYRSADTLPARAPRSSVPSWTSSSSSSRRNNAISRRTSSFFHAAGGWAAKGRRN